MKTLLKLATYVFGFCALSVIVSACGEEPPAVKEAKAKEERVRIEQSIEYDRQQAEMKSFFESLRVARVCTPDDQGWRKYILKDRNGGLWVSTWEKLRLVDGIK